MPSSRAPPRVLAVVLAFLVASVSLLSAAGDASGAAARTLSSVPLGTVPRGVAVNSNSGVIYTVLFLNGTTLALSPVTFTVFGRVATPSPYAVAVDSVTGLVYVSQGERASVSVIDGSGNSVLSTIEGAGTPYAMAVDEPQNLLFAADTASNSLWIINASANSVESRVPMGDTSALAFDPSTHEAFIGNVSSDYHSGSITVVSSNSLAEVRSIAIPVAPMSFAVDPTTHLLFVTGMGANSSSPNFVVIDDTTFQVVRELHLGDAPQLLAAGPSPDVYVSDPGVNRLYEVDGANGQIILNSTGDQSAGISFAGITSMAFSPVTGSLYITENDVTSLLVLSAAAATPSAPALDAPPAYLVALIIIGVSLLAALLFVRRRDRRRRERAAEPRPAFGESQPSVPLSGSRR